jgi:hypothetical protein
MTQPLSHGSAITSSRHDTNLEDSTDLLTPCRVYAGHQFILSVMFVEWDVLREEEMSDVSQPGEWSVHFLDVEGPTLVCI